MDGYHGQLGVEALCALGFKLELQYCIQRSADSTYTLVSAVDC